MPDAVVSTVDLKKYFPTREGVVKAVDGVNLNVSAGRVFGFLGPNGAGKTTTLQDPHNPHRARFRTSARRRLRRPQGPERGAPSDRVRESGRRIGSSGDRQGEPGSAGSVLRDVKAATRRKRAAELIDLLDLTEFADRIVYTYSGGQRRRLDVALGIMHEPQVLFLDEPTTGLDPQNRANLWEQIRKLKATGTTIFLTTHYLEEADVLSDYLAIMDYGRIVAEGTPTELKRQIGLDTIRITLSDPTRYDAVADDGARRSRDGEVGRRARQDCLRISAENGEAALPADLQSARPGERRHHGDLALDPDARRRVPREDRPLAARPRGGGR